MKSANRLATVMLGMAFLGWATPSAGSAQDASSIISGQWKPISGTLHGQNVTGPALNSMSLAITGSSFAANSGSLNSGGSITMTAGTTDQAVFAITTGADANRKLFVKWQVVGNQLTLVFSEQGPPVDFNSTAANKYLLMVYDKSGSGVAAGGGAVQGAGGTGGGTGLLD